MEETIILLHPTKARLRAQLINDSLPGILLLIKGLDAVMNDDIANQWLPYVNIAVGVSLIISVARELRIKDTQHRIVRWFDILAGIALIIEAANHYHPNKIIQPANGYFLIGAISIVRGVFHTRMPHLRRMIFSHEGVHATLSPFKRIHFEWKDITSLHIEQSRIRIGTRDRGDHIIQLRKIENAVEVKSALKEYATNSGIDVHTM
jgi:hypothetical protein